MGFNMLSNHIRNDAWKLYVDISAICRYTEDHSNKYRRWNRRGLIALGVLGLITAISGDYYYIAGIAVAITSFVKLWLGLSDKAGALFKVYMQCSEVRNKYQKLWLEIESGIADDEQVLEMIGELSKAKDDGTMLIGYSDIVIDEKLYLKAHKKTSEILTAQYYPQPVNT